MFYRSFKNLMDFDEESESLFLTNQGIKNLKQLQLHNDFTFKVGEKSYSCNRILASFISPTISQILSTDPLCDYFVIDFEDKENLFNNVMKMINGEVIDVNASNYDFLLLVAAKLGNKEMEDDLSLMSFSENHVTYHNAIRRLISKSALGLCYDCEANFIATHFCEYQFDDLNKLKDHELETIISKDSLKIEDESWLFNFLVKRDEISISLLSHLYFEYLTEEDIEKFVHLITYEQMSGPLWSSITKRLLMRVNPLMDLGHRHAGKSTQFNISDDEDNISIEYDSNNPFGGIIDYFSTKYGGNVMDSKNILISVSGTQWNSPKVVAELNSTEFWVSENEPGSWFMYDFKERVINMTAYSLRGDNSGVLRNWVIEGSNDKQKWKTLDQHDNCDDLHGLYKIQSYDVSSKHSFRYIRLRQTGPGYDKTHYLTLCSFEIFGSLSTNYSF
ncbi:F5/8 type C domain containing protein [Tritrichomonas foetus]|uniref:F5/8 type C domain containing protein n=1 Tax=Tritrichomonas foetus TaxID=1144522 RepID=A0A1J4L0M0_9EUKA|nr:F5/8 type C domain containing protein [Tritrichomonas foetus]|eukprot:OHT15492.1 F5/8 type C domain containing protein [Tritrichomonas foetus]